MFDLGGAGEGLAGEGGLAEDAPPAFLKVEAAGADGNEDVQVSVGCTSTHPRWAALAAPDSTHTTYERELPTRHNNAVLAVLRGLARVPGTDAMRQLTVQGDDRPLWRDHDRFRDALAALVARAAARHGAALAANVPDFDAGVQRTQKALRSLPDAPVTVIHGDLVPPNIHTDAAGQPVAVLDFGFYTTAGDPAFEAAVTASIWDMYGPHAEEHATELTALFARELGYAPATLATYQAAYALTTYDLFGLDDRDGHFRWCAQQLLRNSVFSA
ncbi:phosphotransferase [Streptomyces sp. SAS_260]|uniref:phosphotransferase n=1 Tax=Streptomyces sp. SAS_260 TaxID=3412751 RepID=UPI00403C1AA9